MKSQVLSLELPWAAQGGNSCWDKDTLQLCPALVSGQARLSSPSSPHLSHALEKPLWLPPLLPHLTQILALPPLVFMPDLTLSANGLHSPYATAREELWSGADIPGWKSLCRASWAWPEAVAVAVSHVKSDLHMRWSRVVSPAKVALCFCETPAQVLLLPMLRHGTGWWMWGLPQQGVLMQAQAMSWCETRPGEESLMQKNHTLNPVRFHTNKSCHTSYWHRSALPLFHRHAYMSSLSVENTQGNSNWNCPKSKEPKKKMDSGEVY